MVQSIMVSLPSSVVSILRIPTLHALGFIQIWRSASHHMHAYSWFQYKTVVLKEKNYASKIMHIIICLPHTNVWETGRQWERKPCSCTLFTKSCIFYCKSRKNPYQYYKSHENSYQYSYQVLQVTRTTSEAAMKSKVRMIKSLSP